jgi:HEAT repeat protein
MTEAPLRGSAELDAVAILNHGSGSVDSAAARRAFGLDPSCDDAGLALAVARAGAAAAEPALRPTPSSMPPRAADDPVTTARSSYILRMPADATTPGLSIASLDDVRTLASIVRAGGLFQGRAAVRRIGELLAASKPIPSDRRKLGLDTLADQRRFDLAFEAGRVLATLPGAEGRAARSSQRLRHELAQRVEARVLAFWEGERDQEPLSELSSEDRVALLTRGRELSDVLVRHVAALLEDTGLLPDEVRRLLTNSLEHAGDPRLLPALRSLLFAQDPGLFEPCVRALSRIEDPRAASLLREAYERSTHAQERLQLAAALGRHADTRALAYVRSLLQESDPSLLARSLEALAELGGSDDVQRAIDLLDHNHPSVVRAAVLALGRIADVRALPQLLELRGRAEHSALRADIEEAEAAIAARAELLGEDPPSQQAVGLVWDTRRIVARVRSQDPALLRARARLYHMFAHVCLLFAAARRAASLFEAAAALRSGWLAPVLALALLHVHRQAVAPALAAFRRALDIDRASLERDPNAISALAKTFLRRAEAMEREGRLDIARGLVEEALSYDLRRADPEVRLALGERREAHRARQR